MELNEQQMIEIADRMLADLEKQYLEIQKYNLPVQCPEDDHEEHVGYQRLEGDQQLGEQDEQNEEPNQQKQQANEELGNQDQGEKRQSTNQENTIAATEEKAAPAQTQSTVELMQVFPTEEWIPECKQVNINAQKIKQLTLQMNLPMPAWMQDEALVRNRIFQLFGKGKV